MSNQLSSRDIAQMRVDVEQLMPSTCQILAVTITPDGQGTGREAWGTISADVKCRLDFQSGDESINADALTSYTRGVLSLPACETITPANRVELSGIQYAVISVNRGQSWNVVTRCIVERIARQ